MIECNDYHPISIMTQDVETKQDWKEKIPSSLSKRSKWWMGTSRDRGLAWSCKLDLSREGRPFSSGWQTQITKCYSNTHLDSRDNKKKKKIHTLIVPVYRPKNRSLTEMVGPFDAERAGEREVTWLTHCLDPKKNNSHESFQSLHKTKQTKG